MFSIMSFNSVQNVTNYVWIVYIEIQNVAPHLVAATEKIAGHRVRSLR